MRTRLLVWIGRRSSLARRWIFRRAWDDFHRKHGDWDDFHRKLTHTDPLVPSDVELVLSVWGVDRCEAVSVTLRRDDVLALAQFLDSELGR